MKRRNTPRSRRGKHARSLRFEPLEPRCLLAGFAVNNPGDEPLGPNPHHDKTGEVHDQHGDPTGRITLRSAIEQINVNGGGSISFAGGMTITIGSALDPITAGGVTINGGKVGNVIIRGGTGYDGLVISGGGATIENLVIDGFNGQTGAGGNGNAGLVLASGNNTVQNDYVGTNASGTSGVPNTNGIYITGGGNTVRDSVISGNSQFGIWVRGAPSNQIFGNKIGTDPKGMTAVPNSEVGIYMSATAANNTIGGTSDAKRNIISGNGYAGMIITCEGPVDNVVEGNYIGVDVSGATALANGVFGVQIRGGSIGNVIGGTTASARDIISGSGYYGVGIGESGTSANLVEGDYIGTDLTGTQAVPNGSSGGSGVGVLLGGGTTGNVIGGSSAGARNIISGNATWGVSIGDSGTSGNLVAGNYIGTDMSGAAALPNGTAGSGTGVGVVIANGATGNVVGGTSGSARNVISGNAGNGVEFDNSGTSQNQVEGNYIGTDQSGATALPNGADGVLISDSQNNTIGGATSAAGNIISGNAKNGVHISSNGATTSDTVAGNRIGVDSGFHALPNNQSGVFIDGAGGNTIGGPTTAAANVISGNTVEGVLIAGNGGSSNVVEGNFIGTDQNDDERPNGDAGIFINAVPDNVIGGADGAGEVGENIISYNTNAGIQIDGSAATGNTVVGNDISSNSADGVLIHDAQDNIIGRAGAGDPSNIIAANGGDGIHINGQDATGNTIENNAIGAWAPTGQAGNTLSGVLIEFGSDNMIGGDSDAADNTIGGNSQNGVTIIGDTATGNTIVGNSIGPNARLGIDLGNDGITPMSAAQPITGPNHLQNYPVLYSVTTDAFSGDVLIQGFLRGNAGTTYQVQIYANATLNPLELSEGQEYLGSVSATASVTGNADFAASFSPPADGPQYITATATDPDGNTSEFSPCRDVLRGSVHYQISGAFIQATFQPTVYVTSIAQAAQICGVNHFNWEQMITYAPFQYFTYQNTPAVTWSQQPIPGTKDSFWPAVPAAVNPTPIEMPVTDPIDTPPQYYGIHSAAAAKADPVHFPGGDQSVAYPGPGGVDRFPLYYNEDGFGSGSSEDDISTFTSATRMTFSDTPRVPLPFYSGTGVGNYLSFQTSLAGVMDDFDHTGIVWQGIVGSDSSTTQFTWNSNAAYVVAPPYPGVGGVVSPAYIAVWDTSDLPPVASGGVSNVSYTAMGSSSTRVTLSLSQSVSPQPGRVGQNLTYTFTVTNTGTTAATGVELDERLPAGATVVSVKPSQGTSTQAKGIVTVKLGNMAAGATATVTVVLMPTISGKLTSASRVTDPNGDGGTPATVLTSATVVLPATPGAPELLPADDTGTKGDNTTSVTSPHLTGTVAPKATVQLLDAQNQVVATTTASGSGVYVIQVPGPLALGVHAYAVQALDQYGDASAPSPVLMLTIVSAGPPPFRFAKSSYSVPETGKSVTITVNRFGNLSNGATVTVAPSGGTAVAGVNYKFSSTVVRFKANQSSAAVIVPVLDDKKYNGNTTLKLSLSDPTTHAVYGTTTITIQEKDRPPLV